MGLVIVFILSLISTIRMALSVFVVASLGMGVVAPWGRVVSNVCVLNTKGLLNVKKNICGCSPPGGNPRCCG